jgi:hypothetical protein
LDKLDDVCAICFHDLKPSGPNNVSQISPTNMIDNGL